MTIRRSALWLTLTVALVTGSQELPVAQGSRPPFWALDHRPIAAIMLFNGTWEPGNPALGHPPDQYGLHECWRRGSQLKESRCGGKGGVRWLMDEIQYRHKMFGYRRFMLHLPAGREKSQQGLPLPSAQWHVLDSAGIETTSGSVRVDLRQQLTPWLAENRDVQVLIYQGLRFQGDAPEAWLVRGNMDPDHATVPDSTDPEHRLVVQQNTLGWLNLTPPEKYVPMPARPQIGFAFDNTGLPSTRDALVDVLQDPTLFGTGVRVFVSGEAIPHQLPSPPCLETGLLAGYTATAPWFGLIRFHREHDPAETWSAPVGAHLGFAVRDEEIDTCARNIALTDAEIERNIRSAHDRGFVIIHYGGRHDPFIRDLYATTP